MWLIFPGVGAFSIVRKPLDVARGTLTIRARVGADLDALRKYLPELSATMYDAKADYAFRAIAPREAVMAAVSALAGDIGYDDVKAEAEKLHGAERATVYHSVWAALRRLQKPPPDIPSIFASIGRRTDVLDDDDDDPRSETS